MKSNGELWWEEEVESVYKFFLKLSILSCTTPSINLIKEFLIPSEYTWKFFAPILTINIICLLVVYSATKKTPLHKIIVIIICHEFHNLQLLQLSKTQLNSKIFEVLAFITRAEIEFTIIKDKWIFNFLILIHICEWHVQLDTSDPFSLLTDVMILVILCNVSRIHIMKISFERFVYRKELENTTNRLNTIAQALFEGIIILSENAGVVFYNEEALELLRTTAENLKSDLNSIKYIDGKKIARFSDSTNLIDDIVYLLNNPRHEETLLGISFIGSTNIEWKAKNIIWESKPSLFISIRNANQIIELEKNISKENLKNLILRSASHELKTPLNSIIYFTSELLEDKTLIKDEILKKKLKTVLVSGKLMLSLVNDLLDYSKILTGGLNIQKKLCNIEEIIINTCDLIQLQAEKKKLSVIYRFDSLLPRKVYTDPLRFGQILLNLATNAIRHTLKGKIEISCNLTPKNMLKCYVEDTGIGINDQKLKRMTQELNSFAIPTVDSTGKGLGIHISNLLCKQLGGKVLKGKSTLGKGSIFSFKIDINNPNSFQPIDQVISVEECNENAMPESSLSINCLEQYSLNQSVLIVDDMEFNLEILGSIFKNYGVAFCEAINGKIAIEKVIEHDKKQRPFKVIMMDSSMPEMDGWEASKNINKLYREGNIRFLPVIIGHSAYNSDEDVKLCFESGMAEFLPKPCSPEEIIQTVIKYL
ncbi:unnamed protein product [Blepharisma stoltei]|uniref:Histidine kinase n=1 Tax=Blepharisma stoltei TaxID=1481888 RepID=A0AAU9J5L7_9CILI|nr:unnamed protein product [Blepharisma stoltei]